MAELKSCGVLVYRTDPNPSFLLMRHPHRWDLPKGHIDQGETEFECALRELFEETGIQSTDIEIDPEFRFVHQYTVNNRRSGNVLKQKQLIVYLGKLLRPVEIEVTEHQGFQWFPWQPPHRIQEQTIDPLLMALDRYWKRK